MGVELAHCHHALPLRHGHQQRPSAAFTEFAKRLRRLALGIERIVGSAQDEAGFAAHRGKRGIELALEDTAGNLAVAKEDARLRVEPIALPDRDVHRRQAVGDFQPLGCNVDHTVPLDRRDVERRA